MENDSNQLLVIKCRGCDQLFMPPKYICSECGGLEQEEVRLSGKGVISTYTTIRVAPSGFEDQAPYDLVVVDLAEKLSVTARLVAEEGKEPEIGAPVSFVKKEGGTYWFKLEA